nr:MAG TPA: hypothetical protein [Caudoviricetes sp.]
MLDCRLSLRASLLLLLLKKKARSFDRAFQYELFD